MLGKHRVLLKLKAASKSGCILPSPVLLRLQGYTVKYIKNSNKNCKKGKYNGDILPGHYPVIFQTFYLTLKHNAMKHKIQNTSKTPTKK